MIAFYERWQAAGDVAVALQSAMVEMIRRGDAVNEWASFVV